MRPIVWPIALAAMAITGSTYAQPVLQQEPPKGALRPGQQVFVDDGTCGPGKLKLVTGGISTSDGAEKRAQRKYECIAH